MIYVDIGDQIFQSTVPESMRLILTTGCITQTYESYDMIYF